MTRTHYALRRTVKLGSIAITCELNVHVIMNAEIDEKSQYSLSNTNYVLPLPVRITVTGT